MAEISGEASLPMTVREVHPDTAIAFVEEKGIDEIVLPGERLVGVFAAMPTANLAGLETDGSNLVTPPVHRIESLGVVCLRPDKRVGLRIVDGSSAPFAGAHEGLFAVARRLGEILGRRVFMSARHAQ